MLPDLSYRSRQTELMDTFDMPPADLDLNLKELETINRWLGGYSVSLSGFDKLNIPAGASITVVDIGCGGGDGMIAIFEHLKKRRIKAKMIGIDANPLALAYAQQRCKGYHFEWLEASFQSLDQLQADVWHCSLFAHHFYDHDLEKLASIMNLNSRIGFVVNDLHRHALAYLGIDLLTRLFSGSYLVKNDARLSVARGFSKKEIQSTFEIFGGKHLNISWKWAFRWQITGTPNLSI